MTPVNPRGGLFVTCLVDLFRPTVGFAAVALLERAGCTVEAPMAQTCCGQPAYNSGDKADAKDLARRVIDLFEEFDYVIAPSGSCAGMIREHYPRLFESEPETHHRAEHMGKRTYELVSFLVDVMRVTKVDATYAGTITYHDSCSGLRELGVKGQPRRLLSSVKGAKLVELLDADTCCGFGGAFCIKYPDISVRMAADKAANIAATGADTLLAGDMGCLLNMAGRLAREDKSIRVRHVAEVLAGMTDQVAPIAASGAETV